MADQLLSIDDSTLTEIANAIRSKGGLPSSNKLSFPDGMIAALQDIVTEATITPKITPQAKTLTPSDTSFAIAPGFHDGTGTVRIETEPGSANPTYTEETYYPPAGKFFSSFAVGGIGNAKQMVSGSVTASGGTSFSITGLNFTPEGAFIILDNSTGRPPNKTCLSVLYIAGQSFFNQSVRFGYTSGVLMAGSYGSCSVASGSVTFNGRSDIAYFDGKYQYVIWGS